MSGSIAIGVIAGIALAGSSAAPILLYHGAQRWDGPPTIVAHRRGHAEHGPGIYLTTSYETAAKYAKGGGSVYRVALHPRTRWISGVNLPHAETAAWIEGLPRLRRKREILDGIRRFVARVGDPFPADVLVNWFVNEGVSSGQHGPSLAAFLVEHGADASLTAPSWGSGTGGAQEEDWVVVFNPAVIQSITKVPARDVGPGFAWNLPRVRTTAREGSPSRAPTLAQIRAALERVSAADTAYDPESYVRLLPTRGPLVGHCNAAAWIVQRLLGGDLVEARVSGERHVWNRLPSGQEVDLTSDQFGGDGLHPIASATRTLPNRKTINPRFLRLEERVSMELARKGVGDQ